MSEPQVAVQSIAGLATGVSVVGDGRPVLALHGWGGSIKSFLPVAEQLAALNYCVHVLDLPGFGQSSVPPDVWGVADYMQFVLSYLDAQGLSQVDILGHSFGGRISLMLAAEHPSRVRKMVLADSAGLRTPPSLGQMARTTVARAVRQSLETIGMNGIRTRLQHWFNRRYASEDFLNAGPLRETFIRVIGEDLTPFAVRVQAPTVLIWGDQDQDTPLWQGQKLEQLIPDAGLVVFPGAGHFSYLDRLPEYIRIVDHFLGEEN